jgi:hypothetical protein
MTRLGFCILAFAIVAGCATMSDVIQSKDQGVSQTYPVTFDQAWTITKAVFRWEGADAIEEHKDERYMLTSSGMNLVTAGTVMGAWIDPTADGQMRVTVVTKRRIQTNMFTSLTETTFHKRFAQAVEIVKAGKPLPPVPPD